MKTNILLKLFLLTVVCISLHSCTADEVTVAPPIHTSDLPTGVDGDPILTPPRK